MSRHGGKIPIPHNNTSYLRYTTLGIDLSKAVKKEFLGIGETRVTSYIASVDMKVKHFNAPVTTPVAFTDSPSVDVLLGQEDFFEVFRIKFEKDHDTFELSLVK